MKKQIGESTKDDVNSAIYEDLPNENLKKINPEVDELDTLMPLTKRQLPQDTDNQ